jgi:LytS/YehU family sensor histidine kinase
MPVDRIYTSIFLVPVAACVYLNLLLLVPRYLAKGRPYLFTLFLLLNIAFFSWLNMILFSRLIDYILPGYYFISYYDFPDLLKFFVVFILITTLLKLSKGWFLLMETRNRLSLLEKEHAHSELKILKSQINPHFLFNSLNTLYSLVRKKADEAPDYILKLSEFLRYLLYETEVPAVPLEKELNSLRDYLALQKLRTGPLSSISMEMNGDPGGKFITPLLFLPLVENSFKHGIKGETGSSFINIFIEIEDHQIVFSIRNNIGSIDPVSKTEKEGIGLVNLRKRLDLVYPEKYRLDIPEETGIFQVTLSIPLYHEAEMPDRR